MPSAEPVLGCIGCGNMGGAVVRGLADKHALRLLGHDHTRAKVEALSPADKPGRVERQPDSPEALAAEADIIVLAVKPHQMADMLTRIRPRLDASKLVVSLAAAFSLEQLRRGVDGVCPVARVMPSLPALVGKGVFALCLARSGSRPKPGKRCCGSCSGCWAWPWFCPRTSSRPSVRWRGAGPRTPACSWKGCTTPP